MKEIRKTSQFKKDFKRISGNAEKLKALFSVVEQLARGEELPAENKTHALKGDWQDFMECHIGSDYLLIWHDKTHDQITLVRLGSHSDLFGKGKKR